MPWLAATQERLPRHRQLDLPEQLPRRGAGRRGRLDDRRRDRPDPDIDEPDDRRDGVDDRGDDRGEPARLEQRHGRDQVDERRHRLGRVEDRPQDVRKRSLRADRIPSRPPRTSVRPVATRTLARVCIPCSHRPSSTTTTRQTPAITEARTPETKYASASDDADDQPPRRRRQDALERVQEDRAEAVLDRGGALAEVRRDPLDDVVDGTTSDSFTVSGNSVGSGERAREERRGDHDPERAQVQQPASRPVGVVATPVRGSSHSPARSVRRSRTIARMTIASPAWKASPTLTCWRARRTSAPRPGRADEPR